MDSKVLEDIRRAVADYMQSECCCFCEDTGTNKKHIAILGSLLNVPMYSDQSGYDFNSFSSDPV